MRIESNSIITVCLIAPFSPPEDKIVQFKCVRVTPVSRVQYATAPSSLVNVTFLLLRDGLLHSEPRRHHRWITPSLSTTPIISYCDPRSLETIQINSFLVVVSSAPSTTVAPPPPDVRAASLKEGKRKGGQRILKKGGGSVQGLLHGSLGVDGCPLYFCRTSRIFNCRLCFDGKMSLCNICKEEEE